MKIVPIFAPFLYSFQFDNNGDEFYKLVNFWTDKEQLAAFFKENENLLNFESITSDEAVMLTAEYAENLYNLLEEKQNNLDELFQPLNILDRDKRLEKQKLKEYWLRIYAIKVESKYYIITGGAIKQSQTMPGHPITDKELKKIECCRNYLKEEGIHDIEGLLEIII